MTGDPAANLALIMRETGLSQAQIAQAIQDRGFSINRSTINRWAKPGKVGVLKSDPILLRQALLVCGAALNLPLSLDDLFGRYCDLEHKIKFARQKSYLVTNVVSRCVGQFAAREMSGHLAGHYKTYMLSLFDPGRLRMSLMRIANDDDVSFTCEIFVLRNNRLAGDQPTLGDGDAVLRLCGRMLYLNGICHFLLDAETQPTFLVTIAARVPNAPPPVEVLNGLVTVYGSPVDGRIVCARYLMVRTSEKHFNELHEARTYGELATDHADTKWVVPRLNREFIGPHLHD